MLSFTYTNGKLTAVSAEYSRDAVTRNDMASLAQANLIAAEATELTGRLHIGVDQGNHTSPRYDVIEAPVVGAEVSRGFNGDYYPAGKIVKVSASLRRVQTSDGTVFYRRANSAAWVSGNTWAMVAGTVSRLSREF